MYLDISCCELESFEFDEHTFPVLLTLDLDYNLLRSLNLHYLKNLRMVSLNQNRIEVFILPLDTRLREVNLGSNLSLISFHSPIPVSVNLNGTRILGYEHLSDDYYRVSELISETLPRPIAEEIVEEMI